jgi:hypothetical protein
MPKKDPSSAVLGMLASVGAETRRPVTVTEPVEASAAMPSPPSQPESPGDRAPQPVSSVSEMPRTRTPKAVDEAPRTLRLRTATAIDIRNAWLEAKRDDVLLTAQDFASDLVDEALARRRRSQRTASS